MLIIPLVSLSVGGPVGAQLIAPGKLVAVADDEATKLIERGFVKLSVAENSSGADLMDAVIGAIDELPPDAFGKEGKPHVKALETILGQSITASLRDSAWTAYQKLTTDAG